MRCTFRCFILLGFWSIIPVVLGDTFEYECDMLQRLDYLENQNRETKQLLESLEIKVTQVEEVNVALTKQLQVKVSSGSTYIRWGRTSCPGNGSELVYHGVGGGSHYTHPGAAVNYLCLPLDPTYGEYHEDAPQSTGGFIYGAEYQFHDRPNRMKFFPDNDPTLDLFQQNVPCAVCHVDRNALIMVPAKDRCMPGWTLEYKGLLVTGHYNEAPTEYICLDGRPEVANGGSANENGKVMYLVEGRCGSLPCPPYVNGREITCAVCTK